MKNLSVAFVVLTALLPLRADEFVQNGDFSKGSTYWEGDFKNLADQSGDPDATSMSASTTPSSGPKQGLIVTLKDMDWCKVTQDFESKGTSLKISVTYQFSADTSFSTKAEDYSNVTHSIGFDGWLPIKLEPGHWMLFLSDLFAGGGTYYPIKGKFGSTDPVTFTQEQGKLMDDTKKSITLAFPPGHGTVTITNVSAQGTP